MERRRRQLARSRLCLGWMLTVAVAAPATGHPAHLCLTEMDYNRETQSIEASVKLVPEDFEQAMRAAGLEVSSIEHTPRIDALIAQYLHPRLYLQGADGNAARAQLIGKEISHRALWLYVQLPAPAGTYSLHNTLLHEHLDEQVNTVLLREQGKSLGSLRFVRGTGGLALTVPFAPATERLSH